MSVLISASCQCPSVPHQCHISVSAYHCLSVSPINANQCHLSVLQISATYQCQSVPPISASQCCLIVRISAA
ncbi:unnamed protein product [Staurois parvus]|uniref:Uncharacterized protein n=1 Tax=Staurois parvus TaxID=386267 RepID=A0ABN9GNT3_9NEOB|nr:unnamed protein product [Staurois parvus]